jgi:endo-1,4-beta-xylanase
MRSKSLFIGGTMTLLILSACSQRQTQIIATPTLEAKATDTIAPKDTPTETATSVPFSDCGKGYIALTFDDGPYAGQTDELIAALEAAHLRATFFDWGQHIASNDALVMAQFANGWVGNHNWSHSDMTLLSLEQITTELTNTQNALQAITGQAPDLFRPPYLKSNSALKQVETSLGFAEVMTTIDSKDWAGVSTDEIVSNVSMARLGDVVLMHDNLATTRAAIPRIAEFMLKQKLCPGRIDPATGRAVAP